ncbi:MAG: DUF4382 domain-containing protein [Salinibacter sp.]
MSRYSSFLCTALLTMGLVLTGCDSSGSAGESGALELRMSGASTSQTATRSPTTKMPSTPTASNVDTAYVTIDKISIVPTEDSTKGDSTEVGVTALTDSNFTVDLKNLQSGVDAVLPEIEIPAGSYSQLRLVTADEAQVSFASTNGTQPVMIASGQQTGLKLNFDPFTIGGADDRVEITVNWDVEESLKGAPQGQYVITPAINGATVNVTSVGN